MNSKEKFKSLFIELMDLDTGGLSPCLGGELEWVIDREYERLKALAETLKGLLPDSKVFGSGDLKKSVKPKKTVIDNRG